MAVSQLSLMFSVMSEVKLTLKWMFCEQLSELPFSNLRTRISCFSDFYSVGSMLKMMASGGAELPTLPAGSAKHGAELSLLNPALILLVIILVVALWISKKR